MATIYDLKASSFADGAITLPAYWSSPTPAGITWDTDAFIKSSGLIYNPVSAGDSNGLILVNSNVPTLPADKKITYFMGLDSIGTSAMRHAFLVSCNGSMTDYYIVDFYSNGSTSTVRMYRFISGASTFPLPYNSSTCPAITGSAPYNVKLQMTYNVGTTSFTLSVNGVFIASGTDTDSRFMGVNGGGARIASGFGVSYLACSDDSTATYPFSVPEPIVSIFWEHFVECRESP